MRILVVSLLRLGDLLMAAPAIRALRDQYPDATIDVLINDSSAQARGLIKDVDRYHLLPRMQLQNSLVDPGAPLFQAPHDLLRFMIDLKNEKFDLIVNFTHNRLSGYLIGFFDPERVLGLRLNTQDQPQFGSNWFSYLDRMAREPGRPILHYADTFSYAIGGPSRGPYLSHARLSRNPDDERMDPLVVIQCLTSDEKKNWSMQYWDQCLDSLKKRVPQAQLLALASPSEEHLIVPLQTSLKEKGVSLRIEVTNIKEALDLLMRADLIVTLDTSIKHLAIDAEAPLIEICLGSSDPYRTGAYRDNTYIFKPLSLECSPCVHSEGCKQPSRLCDSSVDPMAVSELMASLLESGGAKRSPQGKDQGFELVKVVRGDMGLWRMVPWSLSPSLSWLKADLEVVSVFAELRGLGDGLIRGEGTLAYQWLLSLRKWFPQYTTAQWRHLFGELQHAQDGMADEVADARTRFEAYLKADKGVTLVHLKPLQDIRHKLLRLDRMNETKCKILKVADRLISEVSL